MIYSNPHANELYGNEIVLFHSEVVYKKRVWIFNLIEWLNKLKSKFKIIDELELKVVVGELSEDTLEIIKHAANHKFGLITIIGGPKVFCEDKNEIDTLLDKYKNVRYNILPIRPIKHFHDSFIKPLFIEKSHRQNETRGSVGIKKAHPTSIETYNESFNIFFKAYPTRK